MKNTFSHVVSLRCALLMTWLALQGSGEALAAVQGTMVAWGRDGSTVPTNLTGVVAVAAGGHHNLALKMDGTVVAWGGDAYGQSTVPPNLSGVVAIAAGGADSSAGGEAHSLALKADRTVVGWGFNGEDQALVPTNLTGVVAIAAGAYHSLALKSDGTVAAWGYNDSGQTSVPEGLNGVVAIAASGYHSLALKGDGTVAAWGLNSDGASTVPVNLTGVVAIAAGYYHNLALKRDGTVIVWGTQSSGQGPAPTNLTEVIAIAAGYYHNLALKRDGEVIAWGYNNDGQSTVPTNASGAVLIAAGGYHSLAVRGSGVRLFVDGRLVHTESISVRGSTRIEFLAPFAGGTLLFTLDGSDPSISGRLYEAPFMLRKSATLRAIAYNADFTQAVQSDPVEIVILPTLSASTEGGGSVTMDPPDGAYLSDGTAVVTATPAPGWTFLQWLGDATGTNPVATVNMSWNRCVQAVFGTSLSNTVVGSGSVARSPAAELYPYGTAVRITAVPQAGNYFALWGNAASGTNNSLTFTVTNSAPTVTAVFATLPGNQHTLTVVPEGFGQVSANLRANRYGTGTNVTLTALPDAGQSFVGWSGDSSGANNPLVVTMTTSRVIRAHFTMRPRLVPRLCGGMANGEEFQFLVEGEPGERYSIEATTNFAVPPAATAWTSLGTATNAFGVAQFNDLLLTNRFFRVLTIPNP